MAARGGEAGAANGEPVRVVSLLAIRESDKRAEHLKVFPQLARPVMPGEFRERLVSKPAATAVGALPVGKIGAAAAGTKPCVKGIG